MNRRFLASCISLAVCATLAGCGETQGGAVTTTTAGSQPAAQAVVVAPQATSASRLEPSDVAFYTPPEANSELDALGSPSLHIIPQAFATLPDANRVYPDGTTATSAYSPAQIRHAYGIDQLPNGGDGQTIAIVDAYGSPTIKADLITFSQSYNLASPNLTVAYQNGAPTATDAGWALETSLDVEWAHAIAPNAKILLVVAKSSSLSDLLACVDYSAKNANQVSMSWGGGEFSSESQMDSHFNKAGVSFLASSGDSGQGMSWPAASPYVTSVGGTTLKLSSASNISSEGAWSGSGGGLSSYVAVPAFQSSNTSAKAICKLWRGGPDVSYNADPSTGYLVYDSTPYASAKGWFQVGGTSAGAPQWAALTAMINSQRMAKAYPTTTGLNTLIYGFAAGDFHDITLGSNGYPAGIGYDLVSGLGSPIGLPLFTAAAGTK